MMSLSPTVYDLGPSDLICSSNNSIASNCDSGPLDYDSNCTDYKSAAFGDFGDSGGEASFLPDRFDRVLGL